MYISTWNVLAYLVISVVVFTKLASLNQPYAHMKKNIQNITLMRFSSWSRQVSSSTSFSNLFLAAWRAPVSLAAWKYKHENDYIVTLTMMNWWLFETLTKFSL
jgi:hypothetical protein